MIISHKLDAGEISFSHDSSQRIPQRIPTGRNAGHFVAHTPAHSLHVYRQFGAHTPAQTHTSLFYSVLYLI